MHHRRDVHPEKRRRCRNEIKGECQFQTDTGPRGCWWKHGGELMKSSETESAFCDKCNICEERFRTIRETMIHKKNNHIEKVPLCKEFQKGNCSFPVCWYRHEVDTSQNKTNAAHKKCTPDISSISDFPVIQNNLKPPEIVEMKEILVKAMQMMTSLNLKLDSMRS